MFPLAAHRKATGFSLGAAQVRVDVFIDFQCPFCRLFELSSGPTLAELVADQLISIVYHPMNFLDEASTTHYSTRAAASSGCAADQGQFLPYAHELFVSQPPEGGPRAERRRAGRRRPGRGADRPGVRYLPGRSALPGLAGVRDRACLRTRDQRDADRTGGRHDGQARRADDHRRGRRTGRPLTGAVASAATIRRARARRVPEVTKLTLPYRLATCLRGALRGILSPWLTTPHGTRLSTTR